MGYFKFDKLDKIVISLTLIIVTMFCIFNTFCFGSEDVEIPFSTYQNLAWTNGVLQNNENYELRYWKIYPSSGYYVLESIVRGGRNFRISESVTPGSNALKEFTIMFDVPEDKHVIDLTEFKDYDVLYLSFPIPYAEADADYRQVFLYSTSSNMNLALGYLRSSLNVNTIWSEFKKVIPFISIVVLFSFGIWLIKHNIIEHSKGRDF